MRILALMEASSVTGPAKNLIGFCRWTQSAAASGLDLQVEIATFCRTLQGDGTNAFIEAARKQGVPIHVIPERHRFDRSVIAKLKALVDERNPDIVQTHNVKSGFLVRLSGLHRSRTWLAFQHGYTTTNWKIKLYNQLDRWSLRAADRVITVCRAFAPALVSNGVHPDRIRVVHNSVIPPDSVVSEQDRQEFRARWGIAAGELVMLTIGRFSKEKGHADLLDALYRLQNRGSGGAWKLILVGAGPEQTRLEELVRSRGLAERVVFAGFHPQVQPFYSIADIFVLPSHSEGSSNVLLEAMAARVPVVATDAGGTPEIVHSGESALLVPSRDTAALAAALEQVLTDAELRRRLSEAACTRVRAAFCPEKYRQTLLAVYQETDPARSRSAAL